MRAEFLYVPVVAVLAAAAWVLPSYWLFLATTGLLLSIHLTGLAWVNELGRMLALAPLAFASIGAWTCNFLLLNNEWGMVSGVLAGVLAASIVGAAIGLVAMRLRGVSLAVLTLSLAVTVEMVLNNVGFASEKTFSPVWRPDVIDGDRAWYLVVLAIVVALQAGLSVLRRSRFGGSVLAVGQSERAAASLGVRILSVKMALVTLSAALSGLSGGLLLFHLGQVNTANFAPLAGLVLVVLTLFVGASSPLGAIIGAVLAVCVPELLRTLGLPLDVEILIFAVGALVALKAGETMSESLTRGLGLKPSLWTERLAMRLARSRKVHRAGRSSLEIEDLSVAYGSNKVLQGLSMRADPGKVTAVIGPNGAGKSTLIDVVTGFVTPQGGSVSLSGEPLVPAAPNRIAEQGVRRTFQQNRAIDALTPVEYVHLTDREGRSFNDILDYLGQFRGLDPKSRLNTLDIGTRRLCEIVAQAAGAPLILLLDEPAAGCSGRDADALSAWLRTLAVAHDIAVVVIEHDLEFIRSTADTAVVINFGRIVASGAVADVLADPQVQAAYLGTDAGDDA